MKKSLIASLLLTLLVVLFWVSYFAKNSEPKTDYPGITIGEVPKKVMSVECETIDDYREEVIRRIRSKQYFISDEEIAFLESKGLYMHGKYISAYDELYNEITNYHYPIIVSKEDSIYLWYTSEDGKVYSEKFKELYFGKSLEEKEDKGRAHDDLENRIILTESHNSSIVYDEDTGKIQEWTFGLLTNNYMVPENSVYIGESKAEGFIFRSGTDVYTLCNNQVMVIAHNVKQVISINGYYDHNNTSQPIFIMTDDSVKIYVGSIDTDNHLFEMIEG